jgi:hypothetical protein
MVCKNLNGIIDKVNSLISNQNKAQTGANVLRCIKILS